MNPLSVPASFRCEASHSDLRFSPATFSAPPGSAGQGETTLRLISPELGDYPYTVQYEAKPAGLEKTIVFKAPLGSTDTVQSFKFWHFAKKPGSYTARIEPAPGHKGASNDFIVESKDIKA